MTQAMYNRDNKLSAVCVGDNAWPLYNENCAVLPRYGVKPGFPASPASTTPVGVRGTFALTSNGGALPPSGTLYWSMSNPEDAMHRQFHVHALPASVENPNVRSSIPWEQQGTSAVQQRRNTLATPFPQQLQANTRITRPLQKAAATQANAVNLAKTDLHKADAALRNRSAVVASVNTTAPADMSTNTTKIGTSANLAAQQSINRSAVGRGVVDQGAPKPLKQNHIPRNCCGIQPHRDSIAKSPYDYTTQYTTGAGTQTGSTVLQRDLDSAYQSTKPYGATGGNAPHAASLPGPTKYSSVSGRQTGYPTIHRDMPNANMYRDILNANLNRDIPSVNQCTKPYGTTGGNAASAAGSTPIIKCQNCGGKKSCSPSVNRDLPNGNHSMNPYVPTGGSISHATNLAHTTQYPIPAVEQTGNAGVYRNIPNASQSPKIMGRDVSCAAGLTQPAQFPTAGHAQTNNPCLMYEPPTREGAKLVGTNGGNAQYASGLVQPTQCPTCGGGPTGGACINRDARNANLTTKPNAGLLQQPAYPTDSCGQTSNADLYQDMPNANQNTNAFWPTGKGAPYTASLAHLVQYPTFPGLQTGNAGLYLDMPNANQNAKLDGTTKSNSPHSAGLAYPTQCPTCRRGPTGGTDINRDTRNINQATKPYCTTGGYLPSAQYAGGLAHPAQYPNDAGLQTGNGGLNRDIPIATQNTKLDGTTKSNALYPTNLVQPTQCPTCGCVPIGSAGLYSDMPAPNQGMERYQVNDGNGGITGIPYPQGQWQPNYDNSYDPNGVSRPPWTNAPGNPYCPTCMRYNAYPGNDGFDNRGFNNMAPNTPTEWYNDPVKTGTQFMEEDATNDLSTDDSLPTDVNLPCPDYSIKDSLPTDVNLPCPDYSIKDEPSRGQKTKWNLCGINDTRSVTSAHGDTDEIGGINMANGTAPDYVSLESNFGETGNKGFNDATCHAPLCGATDDFANSLIEYLPITRKASFYTGPIILEKKRKYC